MTLREQNRRTLIIAISAAMVVLWVWGACAARAQGYPYPIAGICPDATSLTEALTDTTSVLHTSGQVAASGQVERGQGLGGDPEQVAQARSVDSEPAGEGIPRGEPGGNTGSPPSSRNPFASSWLEAEYQFDSREGDSDRILSLEGVSRASEHVDVYGSLDLYSGLDQDLARFTLRAGVFGEITTTAGLAFWYEDFSGSWNERALVGFYFDPLIGGEQPFVRLVGLPLATNDGGVMARVMFDAALHERWSLAGFLEGSWGGEDGSYDAAEPELRYAITDGLWATLEYRRDERWGDDHESLALGLRAGL